MPLPFVSVPVLTPSWYQHKHICTILLQEGPGNWFCLHLFSMRLHKHLWQQRCRGGGGRSPRRSREMPCTATVLLLSPGPDAPHATTESSQQHGRGPIRWKNAMEQHLRYLSGKLHLIFQILAFTTRRYRTRMHPRQLVAINSYQVFFQVFLGVFCGLIKPKTDICNTIAGDEVIANSDKTLHSIWKNSFKHHCQ